MRAIQEIFRAYCQFNEQGKHTGGTDRQSNHAYGDAYEYIVGGMRDSARLVMEVGIADGSGMLAFREIFPAATIVGFDQHFCACQRGERLEFHTGDQHDEAALLRAVGGRQFDVIVEDASHQTVGNLLTLFYLWPAVKPGGVYIVEEWYNIGSVRNTIASLFANCEIVDTVGPFGGSEPLVVIRKPM